MVVFKRKDKGTVIKEDHKIQTQRHYWFAANIHFYLLKMIMCIDMTCMVVCKRKDKEKKFRSKLKLLLVVAIVQS